MTLRNVNEIKTEVATALRELAGLAGESGAASLHERILVDRLPRLDADFMREALGVIVPGRLRPTGHPLPYRDDVQAHRRVSPCARAWPLAA